MHRSTASCDPSPRAVADLDAGRLRAPVPRVPVAARARVRLGGSAPIDPRNVYAATKLHQEHLCAAYAREHGGSSIALRYHNVYGPRMPRNTPYAGVASIFRSAADRGEAPAVFEDGGQRRDFVHVRDVARANLAALDVDRRPRRAPSTSAAAQPHTVLRHGRRAERGRRRCPGARVVGGYRLGDVRHVFASPALAAKVLGFEAEVAFDEGMRDFSTAPLRN